MLTVSLRRVNVSDVSSQHAAIALRQVQRIDGATYMGIMRHAPVRAIHAKRAKLNAGRVQDRHKPSAWRCLPATRASKLFTRKVFPNLRHYHLTCRPVIACQFLDVSTLPLAKRDTLSLTRVLREASSFPISLITPAPSVNSPEPAAILEAAFAPASAALISSRGSAFLQAHAPPELGRPR